MLEHMGLQVLDEQSAPHHARGPGSRSGMHDFGMQAAGRGGADVDVDALHAGVRGRVRRGLRAARSRTTTSTGWCSPRASRRTRSSCCAPTRSTCGRSASPLSQSFIEADAGHARRTSRACWSSCSSRASIPTRRRAPARRRRAGARDRAGAREGRQPVRGPRAAPVPGADPGDHCAPTSGAATRDGQRRSFLSFKFDPSKVPGLPEPKPMFEIFVYSTALRRRAPARRAVARGGLRWSDRPEDFRTEVLGLVKAQMVKNTVIVPVGSKGGFVLKRAPPAERSRRAP